MTRTSSSIGRDVCWLFEGLVTLAVGVCDLNVLSRPSASDKGSLYSPRRIVAVPESSRASSALESCIETAVSVRKPDGISRGTRSLVKVNVSVSLLPSKLQLPEISKRPPLTLPLRVSTAIVFPVSANVPSRPETTIFGSSTRSSAFARSTLPRMSAVSVS